MLAVLAKEVLDNLRDRQAVFYALLFGPVLLPLLIGGSLVAGARQMQIDFAEESTLAIVGGEHAQALSEFLYTRNVEVVTAPDDWRERLLDGRLDLVMRVDRTYGDALRNGRPAPLELLGNDADKDSTKARRRVEILLAGYEQWLAALRLQHRGIDPSLFDALDLRHVDLSNDGASGQLIASMLPFLFIMSMLLGGFYLAIDTTAGERERRSLEPLLGLPVSRTRLVLGKFGATLCFVTLSLTLTAIVVYLLFRVAPIDRLGIGIRFDGPALGHAYRIAAPLAFLISAALIAVAARARSTKEAQTWLGVLMIIPMAPFFALQFVDPQTTGAVLFVPFMSQYELLERVVLDRAIPLEDLARSIGGTLVAAGLLLAVAIRAYSRERLLFG